MNNPGEIAACAALLRADATLATLSVTRDGRVLEASPLTVECIGAPLEPDIALSQMIGLSPEQTAALLATPDTWQGDGLLLRGDRPPIEASLHAYGLADHLLVLVTIKLQPLLEKQEKARNDEFHLLSQQMEEATYQLERSLAELDVANTELQAMDRLKARFYANMNHELRTPLNSILGFAEDALEGMAGPLNDDLRQYFQTIHNSGLRQLRLIGDILDLAKLQSGRMDLHITTFPLAELVEDIQGTMRPLFARKQQNFHVALDALPQLQADRDKTFQVLLNLVSNAQKYTQEGGNITLCAGMKEGIVTLSVEDNGRGIPAGDLRDLFEEFHRVKGPSSHQQGTGLGLAITKRLVEMQGGRIEVQSRLNQGTIFTFTLPVVSTAASP